MGCSATSKWVTKLVAVYLGDIAWECQISCRFKSQQSFAAEEWLTELEYEKSIFTPIHTLNIQPISSHPLNQKSAEKEI